MCRLEYGTLVLLADPQYCDLVLPAACHAVWHVALFLAIVQADGGLEEEEEEEDAAAEEESDEVNNDPRKALQPLSCRCFDGCRFRGYFSV